MINTIPYSAVAALLLTVGIVCRVHAYEIRTHQTLTESAANRSILRLDLAVLRNLGLEKGIDEATQRFPNSNNRQRMILELLRDGAEFEDNVSLLPPEVRVRFHFYNPITGEGLSAPPFIPAQTSSPDWALAGRGQFSGQKLSYWDARQYLLDALTQPAEADRKKAFGLTFQTLGHVIHHLQDMAQPQHVRNDVHCDLLICVPLNAHAPSLMEKFADQIRGSLKTDHAVVGLDIRSSTFTSTFNSPRRFWHTVPKGADSAARGQGIAEVTNRNFLSAGTNFRILNGLIIPDPKFPDPKPHGNVEEVPVKDLDVDQGIKDDCGESPGCYVRFYSSKADNDSLIVKRASTNSIFDEDLQFRRNPDGSFKLDRLFTLNRYNLQVALDELSPRAVGFSAGMINYFFRGKIDFVADPNTAGQYLIKNLGTEPMKGKFRLYYDDQDGNRSPVRDAVGNTLVWDTEVILAAAEGVLAAGASLPVPGFLPPSGPPPKTPGEYMLVFSGDMGEEKAEAGGVGAVVGKQIRNEYKGALYVVGVDANGVITSLRADKDGTKVLSGWDISKRDANNPNGVFIPPPSINVFDPLGFLYRSTTTKSVQDKIYAYKQTEYGPGPIEYETKSLTLISPDNPNAMRSHYGPGFAQVSFGDVVWVARSPDEQIGSFEFRLTEVSLSGRDAATVFTRRFKDATSASRTLTGFAQLPTLTDPFSYQQFYGKFGPGNSSFPLVVSDDGLTIRGFATTGANSRVHVRIVIELAQTPQFRLEQTIFPATISGLGFFQPPYQPAAPCSVEFRRIPDGTPTTVTSNGFVRSGRNDFESSVKEEVPIGNLAGRIVTYVREGLVKRTDIVDESICYAEGTDYDPATGVQRRKYSIRNTANNDVQNTGGTFERFVGGDYAVPTPNTPTGLTHMVQVTNDYPTAPFICQVCQWNQIYSGFDPIPSILVVRTGAPFRRNAVGRNVVRALTDRHADVIYGESASDTQPFLRMFRGIVLAGKEYTADSSPLGEVFFAVSDKSVVIHEPVPGGMPRIQIPENVVKLLAGVWL